MTQANAARGISTRRGPTASTSALLGWLCALVACAGPAGFGPSVAPLRVSQIAHSGDAARRASMRLVLEGLESDIAGLRDSARGSYDRALQVDPNNPYAYLAIARHRADGTSPIHALSFLDRATALLEAQGENSPRVEVHLMGLRGEVLYTTGRRPEGIELLERARRLAPVVWGDGRLGADELL